MAIAYGQITIVDISDLGQLSVYPASNQPYSVIYDPNTDNKYNPDWSTTNLVLTPIIYYGNSPVTPTNSIVKWYRDNNTTAISSGVKDGELTISSNILNENNKLVSYTVKVEYQPPNTGVTLHAEGKITFSLIAQPTTVKSINVTGSNLFLYNGDKTLQSPEIITLQANPQNCSIKNWYYYHNDEKVVLSSETGKSLQVSANNTTYFPNATNSCTFGVQSNIDSLYDEITIVKVYDGAAGDSAVVAVLSNESQIISFDKNGQADSEAYADAKTILTVYDGNDDVTSNCTITPTADSSITGSWDSISRTYSVSNITASGKVSFKITYQDPTTENSKVLYKTFSLIKMQPGTDGADAIAYSMNVSALVVNKSENDGNVTYSPNSIALTGYEKKGKDERKLYPCRFTVSKDGAAPVSINTSDSSSVTYSTNMDFKTLEFKMYAAGGTNTLLDSQTVVQTSDGKKGAAGAAGVGGVYTGLGNSSDQIACDANGILKATQSFTIPFYALQGINKISAIVTTEFNKNGIEISGLNASIQGQGNISVEVKASASLADTTVIPFKIIATALKSDGTEEVIEAIHNYSLTKSFQGNAGVNAVTLQAYAEKGGIFINQQGTDTLKAILTSGATTIEDSKTSYKWFKWNGTTYAAISGGTNSSLTVNASDIESFASYKVTATYPITDGKDYEAYVSILDKSDPLQIYLISTVGEKLVNSQGRGVVYARIYQNGQEIDSVDNWVISATEPANKVKDTIWVDYSGSTVIIKQYSGSAWQTYTPNYQCDYSWTLTNKDNQLHSSSSSRFILVTGADINEKMNYNLTVNYPKTTS